MDPYQPCPCGCGRKIKQCASRKVLAELGAIQQAIEGNQRIAAADRVTRLLASEGESSLLLALLARIQFELSNLDAAREAVERFAAVAPQSPTLKAQQAILTAHEEDKSDDALELLLEALEGDDVDVESLAIGLTTVAQSLLAEGNAAVANRLLSAIESGGSGPLQQLQMEAMMRERQEHIVLRLARSPAPVEETHPLAQQLGDVDEMIHQLAWRLAARRLEELRQEHPDDEQVLRRIGALALLRQREEAAEVWRRIAQLESAEEQERILAEAVAAAVVPLDDDWYVDILNVTYPVDELDGVIERLTAIKELRPEQVPPSGDDDGPPPRNIFEMLDKPLPGEGEELTLATAPQRIGYVLAFGKQTDAPPRLLLEAHAENLAACEQLLRRAAPDLQESEREAVGKLPMSTVKLSKQLVLPASATLEQRAQLQRAARRQALLETWPRMPHPALDGLTPAVAARDKSRKQKVAALVLLQETGSGAVDDFHLQDYLQLRQSLGLPHELIPAGELTEDAPLRLDQLTRIPYGELSDKQLLNALLRAVSVGPRLMSAALEEAVKRPALVKDERIQMDRLCYRVAEGSQSPDVGLQWLKQAAAAADARDVSAAQYLLDAMLPAMMAQDTEFLQQAMRQLTTKHINEPGVREALTQFFQQIGVDPRTGAPLGPPAQPGQPAAAPAAAPAKEESGLWTPGSDSGGGEQSGGGLWLPD